MPKLLIVDNEIYFATNIAKLMREINKEFDAMAVYNEEEALRQLDKSSYDVVVTDVRLSAKTNGIALAETIKNRWPGTSIIIMTAYGSQEVIEHAFRSGTLFYIEKPFRIEKLENLINMVLAKKK